MNNLDKFLSLVPFNKIEKTSFSFTENTSSSDPIRNFIVSYELKTQSSDLFIIDIQFLLGGEHEYHLLSIQKNNRFLDLNSLFTSIYSDEKSTKKIVKDLDNLVKQYQGASVLANLKAG